MQHGIDTKAFPMTDNYIEVKHEYHGVPDDDGLRLRYTDVWYGYRPSFPGYAQVTHDDKVIPNHHIRVSTAWMIDKAGQDRIAIFDRDDIAGLRKLLDLIETDFDRRDMEELAKSLETEVDTDEEDE